MRHIPHVAERLNKIGYFLHFVGVKMVKNLSAVLRLRQQFAFQQDLQMFGNRRSCRVEICRYKRKFEWK